MKFDSRHINIRWGFVFMTISLLFFLPSNANSRDALKIAYPNFYPFFEETESGGTRGFFYDIILYAYEKRMNIKTEWASYPWKRCQAYVKSGHFDAMITVPTKNRLNYSKTHKEPFYIKKLKIFTYKNHEQWNKIQRIQSVEDIKNDGLSIITYAGNGWHKQKISIYGIPTFETPEVDLIWKMLAAKRGDIVIEWPVGAYSGIKRMKVSDKIVETDAELESMPFHLMIGNQSKYVHTLPLFNQIIKDMISDGTMEEILSTYY